VSISNILARKSEGGLLPYCKIGAKSEGNNRPVPLVRCNTFIQARQVGSGSFFSVTLENLVLNDWVPAREKSIRGSHLGPCHDPSKICVKTQFTTRPKQKCSGGSI
jgi:hypothetical protein